MSGGGGVRNKGGGAKMRLVRKKIGSEMTMCQQYCCLLSEVQNVQFLTKNARKLNGYYIYLSASFDVLIHANGANRRLITF